MPDAQRGALNSTPAAAGVSESKRGHRGFHEIWGTLSSITLNNDCLDVGDVIEGLVTPFSITQTLLLIRKHQSSTERTAVAYVTNEAMHS